MFRQLYVFKFGKELLSKKMFIKYFFPHGSENVPVWKMFKSFGKHLYFPNYPPSWFSHTVKELQQFPHWSLTKRKILFPLDEDWEDVSDDEVSDDMPLDFEEKQLGHTKFDRDIRDDDGFEWFLENKHEVIEYFRSDKAEYLDSINKMVVESHANNIIKGKPFNIISLLSMSFCRNGSDLVRGNGEKVEVESLWGKNILVCCTLVPTIWCLYREGDLMDLPFACSVLFSGDYEVVMVVKMRKKWSGDEEIFNHFLSGFPSTWLAVPFFDTLRRDFICKCMGLNSGSRYLFLDQNQKVLNDPNAKLHYQYPIGDIWSKTHYGLDTILDCKPTDLISKVNPKGADDTVSISELNERLVGLYMCVNGRFLSTLKVIYQACRDRRQEFEIVLVYFPLGNGVSPQVFQVLINQVLDQMKLSASWWVLPFNEFVCSRFWKFTEEDQLIILGPHNKFVQRRGKDVINEFGINGYPFIQEYIVKKYSEELRALTLESLLVHGSSDLFARRAMRVPVVELQGKIVLLYADYIQSLNLDIYYPLLSWYFRSIRSKMTDPKVPLDFEVVFVDLGGGNDSSLCLMPWLWCPFDPLRSAFVKNKLNMPGLSVFGRDGQLISWHACQLLDSHGPEDFLSYDGLCDEITWQVDYVCCGCSREDIYADSLV